MWFHKETVGRGLRCVSQSSLCSFLCLTVHGMLAVGEELGQSPEGIFLVHEHEQDGSDLTHPLAVAHLLREHRRGDGFN